MLRAKLRLKPGVTLHVEDRIRQGEVAPAGLACDSVTGRAFSLAPWHCHFMRMVEGGFDLEETVRVVVGFFPAVACRERIREFVVWMEDKNLAEVDWPNLRPAKSAARGKVFGGPARAVPETAGADPARRWFAIHGKAGARMGERPRNRLPWWIGSAVAAVAAVVLMGVAMGTLVRTISVEESALAEESAAKQVAPKLAETIPIRAASPGILTEVLVRDGDRVAKGEVVARIQDAGALKTLGDLRRELGEYRVRRDDFYGAGDWEAYIAVVHKIVELSQRIGEQEAASRPVELRSPVAGEVEADLAIGRSVGAEIGGGELIVKVRTGGAPTVVAAGS